MEKKFGIFNTIEELNRAAAAQKAEGDLEALIGLAEENGLDKMDAEDYFDGVVDCLCTPLMAAIGKLDMEEKALNLKSQLKDWKDYIVGMLNDSQELCEAVFKPDKKLEAVMAAGLKKASQKPYVSPHIYRSLTENLSYDDLCKTDYLYMHSVDFYVYRRKGIAAIKRQMIQDGIWNK